MWVLSHTATKGCSKWQISFPTEKFGEKPDYSNFNQSSWEPHTGSMHNSTALEYQKCTTRTKQLGIEQHTEVRYSVLVKLPYFDPLQNVYNRPNAQFVAGYGQAHGQA